MREGWLDALASDEPTPGGGAAAAMGVAAGAALAAMAARRSRRQLTDADAVAARADRLRAEAVLLADADAAAYGRLLEAMRAAGRDTATPAVQEAVAEATDVPLRVAEVAVEVVACCVRAATDGNPNLHGDATVGALLAEAGARAAAVLVELNVAHGGLPPDRVDRAHALVERAATRLAVLAPVAGSP